MLTPRVISLSALLLCIVSASQFATAQTTYYSRQTGNWNDVNTWSTTSFTGAAATAVPGSLDDVQIRSDRVVTLNVTSATIASMTITGAGATGGLDLSGNTFQVTGNVTINNPTSNGNQSYINVGSGSLTIDGSLTMNGASANNARVSQLIIGTGTATVTGGISFDATTAARKVVLFQDAGSLTTSALPTGGTLTSAAGSTVFITGGLTNTLIAATFANLEINKTGGTLTVGGVTLVNENFTITQGEFIIAGSNFTVSGTTGISGTLTDNNTGGTDSFADVVINSGGSLNSTAAETYAISGNLTMNGGTISGSATGIHNVSGNFVIASGTNTLGRATVTVTGTTDISGTLNITSSTGTKTFAGKVTINNGGTWDNSTGNSNTVLRGGIENNGTFTSGTGTYSFNQNNQMVSGTNGFTFNGDVNTTTNGLQVTNSTAVTIVGSLTGNNGASAWINDSNSSLTISGTLMGTGTLTATAIPNTVEYTGTAAQSIKATNYNNLTISGSRGANNITFPNSTVGISGTFTPSATFSTGNYVTTNNTIDFNGSGSQNVPPLGSANYNNLTHSGLGTATLTGNIGVAGNLNISAGTLDLSSFTADRATGGGTLTVASGATLRIGGTNSYPTNYTTNTVNVASTIEYYGSTQTVSTTPTYGNLILSGSGPKTTTTGTTTTTVAGDFTVASSVVYERASGATATLTLNGTTNTNDGTVGSLANPFNTINVGNAGGDALANNGTIATATALS
ncbi:MAG: beta strand repeat-containing protein, partial [Bacteroidota bacterium]